MTYTSDFLPLEDLPSTSQLSPRPEGRCPPHRSAPANGCRCIWSEARQMSPLSPPSVFPELSLEKSWNGTSGSSGKSGTLTGKALIFVFIATALEWWPTCLLIDCRPSATGGGSERTKVIPNYATVHLSIWNTHGSHGAPTCQKFIVQRVNNIHQVLEIWLHLRHWGKLDPRVCACSGSDRYIGFKLVGSNCNYPLVI